MANPHDDHEHEKERGPELQVLLLLTTFSSTHYQIVRYEEGLLVEVASWSKNQCKILDIPTEAYTVHLLQSAKFVGMQ